MSEHRLRRQRYRAEDGDYDPILATVAQASLGYLAADDALVEAVKKAHKAGRSWGQIAEALGCTKQAAWERYHQL